MSFMFHPHPFSDPQAVNPISGQGVVPVQGIHSVAKQVAGLLKQGKRVALDAYPGANYLSLVNVVRQYCADSGAESAVRFIDAAGLLKGTDEIEQLLAPYLPNDRERDPVLMYGRRFHGGYAALQDAEKTDALRDMLTAASGVLVFGHGCMVSSLRDSYDVRVWMDVTPRTAVLSFKNGHARNVGSGKSLPYGQTMRRNYYVDFEAAAADRWDLIKAGAMDCYITADEPERMQMVTLEDLKKLFTELCARPFRCRPVYLEGVWGGFYFHRLRRLPESMRNCAWIFDLIPLEVSIVAKTAAYEFEAPFFTFVQMMGEELLGRRAYEEFGGYFPIRFNYDDTYHSSGNMSVQCHPGTEYVMGNHDELGRQDESYYICATGQGARTLLGFNDTSSCGEFFREARRAEASGELLDYEKFVHSVPSVPGTQFMIPAGTVHASGRNQVILEIGSLTIGSYTYKLYDYQRIDPQSGKPRPIHLRMGEEVIRGERTKEWVESNLVNHGHVAREGEGWKEVVVGEHDLLYFSLRNLVFDKAIGDDTDGTFHVLALVDGESVKVSSDEDPRRCFHMNSMDVVVVPASIGRYTVTNLGVGTVTVHKTLLKREPGAIPDRQGTQS